MKILIVSLIVVTLHELIELGIVAIALFAAITWEITQWLLTLGRKLARVFRKLC